MSVAKEGRRRDGRRASSPDRVERVVRTVVRTALLVPGMLMLLATLGPAAAGGGAPGLTERDVALLGAVLVLLGLIPAPSRMVARLVDRTASRAPAALEPVTRAQRWQLVAIVLLALAFRGVMIREYWPANQIFSGMTLWDAEMARNLLNGRGFVLNWEFVQRQDRAVVDRQAMVDPQDFLPADDARPGALAPLSFFAHTPGYPLWLASGFAAGQGLRLAYSQWMQAVLDALGCLIVFGIARRLWSNVAGIAGALMYALSPAHVYVAIQTLAAATDGFWALLIAYGLVRLWTDREQRPFPIVALSCVVIGTVCETSMNSLMFTMPLVAAAWAAAAIATRPVRPLVIYLLLAQIAAVALLTPWGLRNLRVYGQFAITRSQFWEFVWELPLGNVTNPWGLAFGDNDAAYEAWIRERCQGCSPAAREAYTRRFLFSDVFPSPQFPGLLARAVAKRVPGLVYSSRLPVDKPFVARSGATAVIGSGLSVVNLLFMLLFPAAALGLLLTMSWSGRAPGAWIGLGPSAFLIAFSLLFAVEHRKTAPAYGYLLALAGVAVAAVFEREPRMRPMELRTASL